MNLVDNLAAPAVAVGQRETGVRPVRIALLSDTHTTRGGAKDEPLFRTRLDRVIEAVNAANVDAVLIAGDLTHNGKPEEFEDFETQIKGLVPPAHYVYGNHDVGAKHFVGNEDFVTTERVAHIEHRLGPSFWTRVMSGIRVIGVNGSLLGSGLPREQEQWDFLEKEMSPGGDATILLIHYPLYIETLDEPGGEYWNVEPEPRVRLLSLLHRGGVRAVLSGHIHYPLVLAEEGILHITTPPVSFGLPRNSQPEGWTLLSIVPSTGSLRARTFYLPKALTQT